MPLLMLNAVVPVRAAGPCDSPLNEIVCRELPGRYGSIDMGCLRGWGSVDPGLRDRHQRRPGSDGQLQDRHHIVRLPDRYLPPWLLRRARRSQGRNHRDCGHHGDRSAGLHDHRRHHQRQPGRLRQLERVGFMVGAKRCGLRYLPRAADPPGRRRRPGEPYRRSSSATMTAGRTCWSRPRTRPGRRTTSTAATASTADRRAMPTRSATTVPSPPATRRPRIGCSTPSTRWSAGWSAMATTSATSPTSTRIAMARRSSSTTSSCPPATMSIGRPGSAPTSTAARDAGVNLAFFSSNEIYWKTRWEPSADGSATPYRTLVAFKEGNAAPSGAAEHWDCNNNFACDPDPNTWTGLWRQTTAGHDGGQPENSLYPVKSAGSTAPPPSRSRRPTRRTASGGTRRSSGRRAPRRSRGFHSGLRVGRAIARGFASTYPSGRVVMSETTATREATHQLSLYRDPESNALVFGAGTGAMGVGPGRDP